MFLWLPVAKGLDEDKDCGKTLAHSETNDNDSNSETLLVVSDEKKEWESDSENHDWETIWTVILTVKATRAFVATAQPLTNGKKGLEMVHSFLATQTSNC